MAIAAGGVPTTPSPPPGGPHTVSAVVVHAVLMPVVHIAPAAHGSHGTFPVDEKVLPASHATWHTASAVVVHTVLMPVAHVEPAAHRSHGAFPVEEKVLPASHATWHTVSVVVVHDCLVPIVQFEPAAHAVQGSVPFPENEIPPTQGTTAPLQTMSAPGTQAVLTGVDPTILYAVAQEGFVRALHSPLEHAQDCVAVGT